MRNVSPILFVLCALLLVGCGSSIAVRGMGGIPVAEIGLQPLSSVCSRGDVADITNDSDYDLEVITSYVSERGFWSQSLRFSVPAGAKGFAKIPSPGYFNWSTCGYTTVTIRVVGKTDGRFYSSVDKFGVCNTYPAMPTYHITDESIQRRMENRGHLWASRR